MKNIRDFCVFVFVAFYTVSAFAEGSNAASAVIRNGIVTGGKDRTYFHMAMDLQRNVAPGLEVLASEGSYRNIFRLADEPGVSMAIVQSDVLLYLREQARSRTDLVRYSESVERLQVMLPLHQEEIHVIVPRTSKLKYIHELRNQRVFMGRPGSGPYITGQELFRMMFKEKPNVIDADSFHRGDPQPTLEIELALSGLVNPGDVAGVGIDAVLLVGGQPFSAVAALEKSKTVAANYKFLTVDPENPITKELFGPYRLTKLDNNYYPELLRGSASGDTLAVQAYLVTVALGEPKRRAFVEQFAEKYCKKFDALVADKNSHPKWKFVTWKPGTPFPRLVPGWKSVPQDVISRLTECRPTCVGIPHPTIPGKCI